MPPMRVRYQTIEIGKFDLHLRTLRDNQQFQDQFGVAEKIGISSATWPLFGVVWPSSMVLANFLLDFETQELRILEVGCGIGLASLLLNKKKADITATDYHPEAGEFLLKNVALNEGKAITFERIDWNDLGGELGLFDLIVGSDILYEDEHIDLLATFINAHAKPQCEIVLVDPGRGRKNKFTKKMTTFGYSNAHEKPIDIDYLKAPFKGHILRFNRKESL